MVIDLIFVGAAIFCAVVLATGKPINISVTHKHIVDAQHVEIKEPEVQSTASTDAKNLPEIIQEMLGVTDEE